MTTMPQWTMESFIALSKAFQAALTMQGAFEFEAAQNPPADVWSLVRRGSDAVRADRPYYRQGKGSRSTSVSSVFRFRGLDSIWKTTCFNRFQGAKKICLSNSPIKSQFGGLNLFEFVIKLSLLRCRICSFSPCALQKDQPLECRWCGVMI